MNLGILFGSSSNEHEISIVSATAILKNLNKKKYHITPIYLDKNNTFYKWHIDINKVPILKVGEYPTNLEKIKDPFIYLKQLDLIWIMIHGKNGEDGVIASIFDFLKIKYIGHNRRVSTITMDKILTKTILEENGIKTAPYLSFTKYNNEFLIKGDSYSFLNLIKKIEKTLTYPLFVKPASSGSSIGINKVTSKKELKKAIIEALAIDNHILIEEEIPGRELECAVLEHNKKLMASNVGEVLKTNDFYTYKAKYHNQENNTQIPANLKRNIAKEIQKTALKIFKILECHIYSRIDFFLTKNNEIILNEINTIPGFTSISMYPKLFETSNISYSKLLDYIINEAFKN